MQSTMTARSEVLATAILMCSAGHRQVASDLSLKAAFALQVYENTIKMFFEK